MDCPLRRHRLRPAHRTENSALTRYNTIVPSDKIEDETKSLHQLGETSDTDPADFSSTAESYLGYARFVQSILGADTPVAFIHIPFSYLVHAEDVNRFSGIGIEEVAPGRERISLAIDRLHQEGVRILNTLPALIESSSDERLYYWLDIHFTPAGNRVVAEAAIPFLRELILEDLYAIHEPMPGLFPSRALGERIEGIAGIEDGRCWRSSESEEN